VVEVPEGLAEQVRETVRETMTEAMQVVFGDKVPFPVEVAVRKTWGV
jgi:DNA polymerase I-like protein with 3'-5' exonuclease and polymerase domains